MFPTLILGMTLLVLGNCDANGTIEQIDNADLEKQRISNRKYDAIVNLSDVGIEVKNAYLERLQAHQNSVIGYA